MYFCFLLRFCKMRNSSYCVNISIYVILSNTAFSLKSMINAALSRRFVLLSYSYAGCGDVSFQNIAD